MPDGIFFYCFYIIKKTAKIVTRSLRRYAAWFSFAYAPENFDSLRSLRMTDRGDFIGYLKGVPLCVILSKASRGDAESKF